MNHELLQYLDVLAVSEVFARFSREDLIELMEAARARVVELEKDQAIYRYGDAIHMMGIVLEGTIFAEADNAEGEKTTLNRLTRGDEFGAYLVVSGARRSPMRVYAGSRAKVMYFDIERLATSPEKG